MTAQQRSCRSPTFGTKIQHIEHIDFCKLIDVDVPTDIAWTMQFGSGLLGAIFTTFDAFYETQAHLEIVDSKGTLLDYKKNSRALRLTFKNT